MHPPMWSHMGKADHQKWLMKPTSSYELNLEHIHLVKALKLIIYIGNAACCLYLKSVTLSD